MATPAKAAAASSGAKAVVRPVVNGAKAAATQPAKTDEIVRKSVTGTPTGAKSMVVPQSAILSAMPDFIAHDEVVVGTEGLEKYTVLSRFKVIQKTAAEDLLDVFPVGSVILSPSRDLVCGIEVGPNGRSAEASEVVHVIPICHYREFATWRKYEEQAEGEKPVLYSTLDETDVVAIKSRDEALRNETLPDGRNVVHCEHLNFVLRVHEPEHPLHGQIAVMTFMRGQHRDGRELARMVKMRRRSIFACVFAVKTTKRENAKGSWYAFEFANPEGRAPWVETQELYDEVKGQYEAMMDLIKGQRVRVNYDDEVPDGASPVVEDDDSTPI